LITAAKALLKELMSRLFIFDACILIDQFRSDRWRQRVLLIEGHVRQSSVVLSELWRGATTDIDAKVIRNLEKGHPALIPTGKNWIESGQILSRIRSDHGFMPSKLRDLHFDLLIALTAHSFGATLITSNRSDFELIQQYRSFDLEIW
jgi:predicted nucleic acid-binding protein